MAKILDLIYRVTDKATPGIRRVKTEQDKFNVSMKDAAKIAAAASAAFASVGKVTVDLIMAYQDYTIAAGEMAHTLGVTVEEASAMIEASNDLGIEVTTLEAAFKAMSRNGIDPSIAGLVEVRSRLGETTSDADRMALALKLLGKSGADLLPLFDQLTDQQLADFVSTMSDAQVVTEAEYQAALRNRAAIAEMADIYETAKLSVGGFLAEGLIPYVGILKAIPNVLDAIIARWKKWLSMPVPQIPGSGPVGKGDSSSPGGSHGGTQRATGGPVAGGESYMVGERGPELFTPGQSGSITSNEDIGQLTQEIRRMLRTLPVIMRDAAQKQ